MSDELGLLRSLEEGDQTALRRLDEGCRDDLLTVAGGLLADRTAADGWLDLG